MQNCWLEQNNRSTCILFLAGWGMDAAPFRTTFVEGHDLLVAYDYRQVEPSFIIQQIEKYDTVHLIAWSMGVWIAGTFFSAYQNLFESITAINGTLKPIDDQCGIPAQIFDDMISNFSADILKQFYQDMFDKQTHAERFLNSRPERAHDSILAELRSLRNMYDELGPGDDIFSCKIVGTRDRIFPARSQQRSWGKENCERIKASHFPFYEWSSWDSIPNGGCRSSCK